MLLSFLMKRPQVMISFIIPAHNEELYLGQTLTSVAESSRASDEPFEVIVVDDASTDRTSAIAEAHQVRLIHVNNRQIAATRNAGAAVATGDVFFFVDADTQLNPEAVREALQILHVGAVGGGCVFRFDGVLPLWAKILYPLAVFLSRRLRLVGGCCLFCTREVFQQVGGFNERYYAAEEVAFIKALKARGRFVIPRATVVTSGRKLRVHSCWKLCSIAWNWMFRGPEFFQKREGLDIWYGERKEDPGIVLPPLPPREGS